MHNLPHYINLNDVGVKLESLSGVELQICLIERNSRSRQGKIKKKKKKRVATVIIREEGGEPLTSS